MSELRAQRIAVVEDWFRALGEGDVDGMERHHTADIVWELMPGPAEAHVPWTGRFEGRAGVETCMAAWGGAVEGGEEGIVLGEILAGGGDTLAVPGHTEVTAKTTGRRFRMEFVEFFRFRGDKIAFMKVYSDTAAARAALAGEQGGRP
ncbi:MAG: nuclear transport factor 2 family protein [Rhodospirillaceae bacterium]|jgi:ketosteroid isomerase-like protein|nr:nuclear transport factor 2 family protein [Rhodospirillaceae bacterium]MBT6118637.1 nuclear transport factor 2 family protein [Rhodospirillaceae bacterium]